MREHRLDACLLEPPEPFVKACDILQKMTPGEYLHMYHRRIPYPLFDFCRSHKLSYHIVSQDDAGCELLVYFESDHHRLLASGIL